MISQNILVWNVRGLNSPARRAVVKGVVYLYRPAIVCFQESKLAAVDLAIINDCCGPTLSEFLFSPAMGTRGGIILAWNPDLVDMA
jgi:exonuclease III